MLALLLALLLTQGGGIADARPAEAVSSADGGERAPASGDVALGVQVQVLPLAPSLLPLAPSLAAAGPLAFPADVPPLSEPARYTVCADTVGRLTWCGTREPLCWDERRSLLQPCAVVERDKHHGTLWRVSWVVGGHLFDVLTTGIARSRGAHEANGPLIGDPNEQSTGVEIRVGAKGLAALAEVAALEFVARGLNKPKLANGIAVGSGAFFFGIGVHNLAVGFRW